MLNEFLFQAVSKMSLVLTRTSLKNLAKLCTHVCVYSMPAYCQFYLLSFLILINLLPRKGFVCFIFNNAQFCTTTIQNLTQSIIKVINQNVLTIWAFDNTSGFWTFRTYFISIKVLKWMIFFSFGTILKCRHPDSHFIKHNFEIMLLGFSFLFERQKWWIIIAWSGTIA